MNCSDAKRLVDAYLDGELDAAPGAALAAHLDGCDGCAGLLAARRAVSRVVNSEGRRFAAPAGLRTRLGTALAAAARPAAPPRPRLAWRPLAMAASVALAMVLSSGVTAWFTMPGAQDRLADEVVSSHVRSLMAAHLTDVLSSDQHTVKPWFNGRIDLSPPVDDLTQDGFELVGGRLDYLDQHPAAALVYRYRQHPINLFVLPADVLPHDAEGGITIFSERGYNVVRWRRGGMSLWAVSDLNLAELRQFETLFDSRITAAAPS